MWFSVNSSLRFDPLVPDLFCVFVSRASPSSHSLLCHRTILRFLLFFRALSSKFIVFENRHFQMICENGVSSPKWLYKMLVLRVMCLPQEWSKGLTA